MPSQEEQDAVVWYVLKRPLVRPNTSYKKGGSLYIAFSISQRGDDHSTVLSVQVARHFFFFPPAIYRFYTVHHTAFIVLLALLQFMIGGIIALKPAIIGAIRLYQRYAPEDIRRRCLFKPTCSEYAILAVQKYGVIKGMTKTYVRLFKKCKGRIYQIDEP